MLFFVYVHRLHRTECNFDPAQACFFSLLPFSFFSGRPCSIFFPAFFFFLRPALFYFLSGGMDNQRKIKEEKEIMERMVRSMISEEIIKDSKEFTLRELRSMSGSRFSISTIARWRKQIAEEVIEQVSHSHHPP
jgi:hypothetical protein